MKQSDYEQLLSNLESGKKRLKPLDSGVCTTKPKQDKGLSLERASQGEDASLPRFAICFKISSRRPADWDNHWVKAMQDAYRNAGILHDDAWNVLEGSVVSKKAQTENQVGMVIELNEIQ